MKFEHTGQFLHHLRKKAPLTLAERRMGFRSVTQEVLTARLGKKANSKISEIENGVRQVTAETIHAFCDALQATHAERYMALGLGGYLPKQIIPPIDEVISLLEVGTAEILISYPHPAYIVDYWGFIWALNGACVAFTANEEDFVRTFSRPINLIHGLMDSQLYLARHLKGDLVLQIKRFKALNLYRQHEPIYQNFVNILARDMTAQDARRLKKLWDETPLTDDETQQVELGRLWFERETGETIFYEIVPQFLYFPSDIFTLVRLIPDRTIAGNVVLADAFHKPFQSRAPFYIWRHRNAETLPLYAEA